MSGTEIALVMTASATLVTALVSAGISLVNAFNITRIEKNTNSMAQRNEAIAEKLGVEKGKASEKANPS
jgi:hypothetical protein